MKDVEDFYPLSPMQQGMLFHSRYAPDSGVYVEQVSCTLRGDLDAGAFERAWQQVVDRHSVLRTAFVGEAWKEPVQVVRRQVDLPFLHQDWRKFPPAEQAARLGSFVQEDRRKGFDLEQAPLMRLALMRTAEDVHRFVWTHHHILLDGWSIPILLQEVFAFYDACSRGQDLRLEPRRPYRDYIVWLKQQDLAQAETFWRRILAGFTSPTDLVVDRPVESVMDGKGRTAEREARLSKDATAALQSLARRHQLTLNTLVQGAWALLLSRYSGDEDVVFGATVSGRPADLPGSEFMIGLFINTLPVRVRVERDAPVVSWLRELQAQQVELRQYEYSPLVQIQKWSDVLPGQPLFQSISVFENYPIPMDGSTQDLSKGHSDGAPYLSKGHSDGTPYLSKGHSDGTPYLSKGHSDGTLGRDGSLVIEDVRSVEQPNYPLTVVGGPAEELVLKIVYDCDRFDDDVIRRMLGHLGTLLQGMAADPDRELSALPLLTPAERQQILVEWNDTRTEYGHGACAHKLFETQVARTPEAVAVTFEDDSLTYLELNRRANQLAHRLQRLGVGPESRVGICVERSLELIVGILGILKAGGAYVPLDPGYPPERIAFMLEDAHMPVLLTQQHLLKRLPFSILHSPISVLLLDADWPSIAREPDTNPISGAMPENLAYVIYTSGSTGRPKGTLLHHRGLCNFASSQALDYDLMPGRRMLQFASFSFDSSVAEIFPALLSGASLCLARRETLLSTVDLVQLLKDRAITTAILPPALLMVLPAEELLALQTLLSAGEACTREIVARWAPGRRFFNAYGPTEATVGPTWYLVEDLPDGATSIPIGRPIANTQAYVVDAQLRPVPIGVPGELMIGGVGVARGYLNRPGLTAQKFIPDPFGETAGGRLYRTGDLARFLPDGNIDFLGRLDHQVKVRGFRIELGEVEAVLREHESVGRAVVVAREDRPGDRRLVAYVVAEGEGPRPSPAQPGRPLPGGEGEDPQILRQFLRDRLPEYMIPSAFVWLEELPLTPNRKVDRQALPVPEGIRPSGEKAFVPPRDALELQLTQMWEEILNIQPIGVKDNFFELGGHSLLAVRLVAQIRQRFGATFPLTSLFQEPTVEQVASVLRQQEGLTPAGSLVPLQPNGSGLPLFFVHPSGGSVHWYADLARHLGAGQPFYGLQAQGLNGDEGLHTQIHTRIEDMAAAYVKALLDVQPDGPYRLGSWSMGVVVAFEMAQQLRARGREVDLLIMLDQGPIVPAEEPEDDAAYLVDVFGKHVPLSLDHLRQLGPDEQLAHVWKEARKAEWLYPDITLPQFGHFVRLLRTHTEAWRAYQPQVYSGRIILFRASESTGDGSQKRDMGWGRLTSGEVEVHEVPGDHISMIHEPHVRVLAERLRGYLDMTPAMD